MSIKEHILALKTDRDEIRTSLANKGVNASTHGFDDFARDIDSIVLGGNVQASKPTIITSNGDYSVKPDSGYDGVGVVEISVEVPQARPIEISTDEDMEAVLQPYNIGKVYKFVGTSNIYETGDLYVVEESS